MTERENYSSFVFPVYFGCTPLLAENTVSIRTIFPWRWATVTEETFGRERYASAYPKRCLFCFLGEQKIPERREYCNWGGMTLCTSTGWGPASWKVALQKKDLGLVDKLTISQQYVLGTKNARASLNALGQALPGG